MAALTPAATKARRGFITIGLIFSRCGLTLLQHLPQPLRRHLPQRLPMHTY